MSATGSMAAIRPKRRPVETESVIAGSLAGSGATMRGGARGVGRVRRGCSRRCSGALLAQWGLSDQNPAMPRQARQHLGEDMPLDRDAAGRGCEARAGEVPENRTAATANHRPVVPAELDDDVVEMILALEPLLGFAGRAVDQAVVAPVFLVVAPGVARSDPLQRQQRAGAGETVGAVEDAAQRQAGTRRAAVAFALVGADAAAAERAGKHRRAGNEEALAAVANGREDPQRGEIARAKGGMRTVSHGDSRLPD